MEIEMTELLIAAGIFFLGVLYGRWPYRPLGFVARYDRTLGCYIEDRGC